MSALLRRVDRYLLLLIATVVLAALLPARGEGAVWVDRGVNVAVAALFLFYGARLKPEAIWAGLSHWRLQALIFASTYILFPLVGLAVTFALRGILSADVRAGLLFLCLLPSTVQSSIAFTSVARGNVAAAVCSASASNFAGIFVTPLLVGTLVVHGAASGGAGSPLDAIVAIVKQLLLPFLAGQLLRPWIGTWIDGHKPLLKIVDQGSILLVVYTAFSESVNDGLWHKLSLPSLVGLGLLCCLMLAIALGLAAFMSRRMGFSREDEITIVFCGSKKSLSSGIPMAKVFFAPGALGMVILPLMLFHQIQLMVCAILAARWAQRDDPR